MQVFFSVYSFQEQGLIKKGEEEMTSYGINI
jgi:hypothetical protein